MLASRRLRSTTHVRDRVRLATLDVVPGNRSPCSRRHLCSAMRALGAARTFSPSSAISTTPGEAARRRNDGQDARLRPRLGVGKPKTLSAITDTVSDSLWGRRGGGVIYSGILRQGHGEALRSTHLWPWLQYTTNLSCTLEREPLHPAHWHLQRALVGAHRKRNSPARTAPKAYGQPSSPRARSRPRISACSRRRLTNRGRGGTQNTLGAASAEGQQRRIVTAP